MSGAAIATAVVGKAKQYSGACILVWGVVYATHTGPNTVDVYINGSATLTPGLSYAAGYSPSVSDNVYLLKQPLAQGTDYIVLGKTA